MSQGTMSNIPTRFAVTGDVSRTDVLNLPMRSKRRRRRDRHAVYFEVLEERTLFTGSPPVVGNFSVPVYDNSTVVIGTNFFGVAPNYTDPESDPLFEVQIVSLPTQGTLVLSANSVTTPVTAGQTLTLSDLGDGTGTDGLIYEANSLTGTDADSFQWNASDGTNFADNPANVIVNVFPPSIVNIPKTTNVNTPITFTSGDFTTAYTSTNPLQFIDIESLPTNGTLTFNGATFAASSTQPEIISISQIGLLTYTPNSNFVTTSNSTDNFVWVASDGSDVSNSADVNVTVNSDLNNATASVFVNSSTLFSPGLFLNGYHSGNPLQSISITALPQHGTLTLLVNSSAVAITLNQVIASGDVGGIRYTPTAGFVGSDAFQFTASDGNFPSNPATVTVSVNSFYTPMSENVDLNTPFVFTQGNFTSSFGGTLQSIKITRVPSFGGLFLTVNSATTRVSLNQVIPLNELGDLSFRSPTGFTGTDSLLWEGSTDGTTFQTPPGQITFTVAGPSLSDVSSNVGENTPFTLVGSSFTSALHGAGALSTLKILSLPSHGTLTLAGSGTVSSTTVLVNQTFTAAQIGSLIFTPAANFTGNDSFKFTANDGQAYIASGAHVNLNIAALLVTGSGISIANGDKSPATTDFTDFGNSASGVTLTRTYVITNLTNSSINFTDGGHLVEITPSSATEFTLLTPPTATLAAGATTSFTISFNALHAGVQKATLTLPFADSIGTSSFAFTIQGTGALPIATYNSSVFTTASQTNSDNQTLIVTSQGGGKGNLLAQNGDVMYLTYTGRLLDGTVFDASTLHDNVPIAIRLDDTVSANHAYITNLTAESTNSAYSNLNVYATQVIDGWNFGLRNMKPGEHRTLIIPYDFGYGNNTNNSSLALQTLIFDVTCTGIDDAPSWGITNSTTHTSVSPGSKNPSTTNGTDFGTLAPGQSYVGQSFFGTNNSPVGANGIPLAQVSNVGFKITGANAGDFIATGTFANFNLFFKPTGPGVRTATIHFLTNDPAIKDFTFNVRGQSTPYVDLFYSATGTQAFTETTATNGDLLTTIPVTIQNFGNVPVSGSTPTTDITVTAFNTTDTTSAGVVIGEISNASFVGLGSGKTKTFNVPVTIPHDLASAGYNLVLGLNGTQAIAESVTSNDSSTTSENISGTLISTTIPSHVQDTTGGIDGSVTVQVTNSGQYTLPTNEQVSIQLQVLNTSTNTTTVIGAAKTFSIGGLKANTSQTFTLPANSTASFTDGPYQIQAVLTATPRILESSISDNTVSLTASSGHLGFTTEPAGIDLSATIAAASAGNVSSSGGNLHLKLPVTIKNNGDIAVSATASTTDIQIFLHSTTATANADTLVGTISAQSIKNLAPDASTTVDVPLTIPLSMTGDTFTYLAKVNLAQNAPITDTNLANNTASGAMNLSGFFINDTVPGTITHTAPSTKATVFVALTNSGNLSIPGAVNERIQIIAHNESTNANTVIGTATQSTKDLAGPAGQANVTFKITIPHNMAPGVYDIEAQIVPTPGIPQSVLTDDLITQNQSGAKLKFTVI